MKARTFCWMCALLASLFLIAATTPALGDDGQNPPPRPAQPGARPGIQGEGPGPRLEQGPGPLVDRMAAKLNLSEEQKRELSDMMVRHYNEQRRLRGETGDAFNEEFRGLRERMQAARQSGDQAEIDKVQAELKKWNEDRREQMMQSRLALNKKILSILNPDQQVLFREMERERQGLSDMLRIDPRELERAVSRLELGPEQKAKIDAIFTRFKVDILEAEKLGPAKRLEVVRQLNSDVMKELTQEQVSLLREMSDNRLRRPPGRERGGKGALEQPGGADLKGQPNEGADQKDQDTKEKTGG
ncbi:MAG: Spy/CpxP family protein refolding chaperone [Phycisphaerae bacterium]|nr:hypothetical protein [Phycisphaerae bacterium]NUQ44612.1 Spy/CpxP family protein refolding chaperone [Phycisphaerae bacterium]